MYLLCGGSNNVTDLEAYVPEMQSVFSQNAMLPEESVTIYYQEL